MLKKINKSKSLWKATAANRRRRKVQIAKQKVFDRHRSYYQFLD